MEIRGHVAAYVLTLLGAYFWGKYRGYMKAKDEKIKEYEEFMRDM